MTSPYTRPTSLAPSIARLIAKADEEQRTNCREDTSELVQEMEEYFKRSEKTDAYLRELAEERRRVMRELGIYE
jgi:uncharacterized iron-regulated protein